MTFKDWILTNYPGPSKVQAWGLAHILTLVGCFVVAAALALIFKKRSTKARRIVVWVLAGLVLFFEVTRRIVNFTKITNLTFTNFCSTLLPRPWCAISCWAIIIAVIVNKKWAYNYASISAMICAIIFFAYPGVGFKSPYFLFDDLYSVATHSLLLVSSISFMTLGFTDFKYKQFWKEAICLAVTVAYAFLEIYVLKIEADPLYFMPGNDVQEILGLGYGLYLFIYIAFMLVYFNLFPAIQTLMDKCKKKKDKSTLLNNNN